MRYINLFLNTLDHLFSCAGLKLKLQETWYSKNLFEYSKVRFIPKKIGSWIHDSDSSVLAGALRNFVYENRVKFFKWAGLQPF